MASGGGDGGDDRDGLTHTGASSSRFDNVVDELNSKLGLLKPKKSTLKRNADSLPDKIRHHMIDREVTKQVRSTITAKKRNYEIRANREIPRALGLLLAYHHRNSFLAIQKDIDNNRTVTETEPLTTERYSEGIQAKYIRLCLDGDLKFDHANQASKLESIESDVQVIIEEGTPDDKLIPRGFLHDYMKMQVETDTYSLYFSCRDITTFPCDAIVCSNSQDLAFYGKLAKDISQAAGERVVQECADHISKWGNLDIGQVLQTTAGNLESKVILHVPCPRWRREQSTGKAKQLYDAIIMALETADELNMYSLALPAVSSGGFGFPIAVSVCEIFKAIRDYFDGRSKKGMLTEVNVVDINSDVFDTIYQQMAGTFGGHVVMDEAESLKRNQNSVCFHIHGKNAGEIDRVQDKISNVFAGGRSGTSVSVHSIPSSWTPMHATEHFKFETLSPEAMDYIELTDILNATLNNVSVLQIERVQNKRVYTRMLKHKEKMEPWTDEYKKSLWIGTTQGEAFDVKKDGFNVKKARNYQGTFGTMPHFATSPTTANGYTRTRSGPRFMFRCTVLVGKPCTDTQSVSTDPPSGYDSVTTKSRSEYVVFRDSQVYPDYMTTYTCG